MLKDESWLFSKTYLAEIISDMNASGDAKVQYLEFDSEDPTDGIGEAIREKNLGNLRSW
jgi:hypothetical protein